MEKHFRVGSPLPEPFAAYANSTVFGIRFAFMHFARNVNRDFSAAVHCKCTVYTECVAYCHISLCAVALYESIVSKSGLRFAELLRSDQTNAFE